MFSKKEMSFLKRYDKTHKVELDEENMVNLLNHMGFIRIELAKGFTCTGKNGWL